MQDKELKHEFELERVILFSDAVFAIIITIMMLDIKIPEGLKGASPEHLKEVFKELLPKIVAYICSFGLIGVFWTRHLKIFKHIRDYDIPLIVFNLLFLLVISLFPFAISTVTSGLSLNSYWTVDIYLTIILSGIFAQTLIIGHIVKNKKKLAFAPSTVEHVLQWKAMRVGYILYPLSMVILVALNVMQVSPGIIMYVLAFYGIAIRILSKKYYPKKAQKINAGITGTQPVDVLPEIGH